MHMQEVKVEITSKSRTEVGGNIASLTDRLSVVAISRFDRSLRNVKNHSGPPVHAWGKLLQWGKMTLQLSWEQSRPYDRGTIKITLFIMQNFWRKSQKTYTQLSEENLQILNPSRDSSS